jgi:nitrogen fixation protein NifU and related proteins
MPLEEDELYQQRILDHYEEPFHRGHCPAATHCCQAENPLCGDVVCVELSIEDDGTVRDAYFNGDGCCISQASASMLVERINGKPLDDIKSFTARDMLSLFGAKLTPNRQKCCLLCWRALQSAVYSPLGADGAAAGERGCG